uniref:Uncharacterized protein n=1 Tax=Meloidogyne enterolobii TaxID=390850 RepID=A0A6V7WU68_MELEN|nr:unnamed protein product [Meloidogyne enterolobii]
MYPILKPDTAPELNLDVLLSVAEKLLFSPDNDFRLDLRDPNADVINFMFAGPICRLAFFIQFRRLVKLSVNLTEIQLSCPTPIQGVRGMLANNKEFFQGPFVVSDQFFLVLFLKGILQPKLVDSFFKFGLKCNGNGSSTAGDGSQPSNSLMMFRILFWNLRLSHLFAFSSLEAFTLFWGFIDFYLSGSPESISRIPKEDFEHCSLELDFVKIQDDTSIFKHITRILNLNATTLLLDISSEFHNCVSSFNRPKVFAGRTLFATLSYTIDAIYSESVTRYDFPFDQFTLLLFYVADCCPNLKAMNVHFQLQGEFSDDDFKVLSKWLSNTFKEFISGGVLSSMGLNCDLIISFRVFFPESTLMEAVKMEHELVKMGEQKQMEGSTADLDVPDTYTISRQIKIQENPPINIVYSLIGIEDDSTNNDWDGFHGNMPIIDHFPLVALEDVDFVGANYQQNSQSDYDSG